MANRLALQTSPYLLQHASNPVDWYPWGEAALDRARELDRPLLVSIGYAACHWCHVMAHESFSDPETAALMNERFVCVKVDREERPDVDALYIEAVQAMTGQGGWPLNVFLTPEQVPFYGGTYFPPRPVHGMPPWRAVLDAVADAWETKRGEIRARQGDMVRRLQGTALLEPSLDGPGEDALARATDGLRSGYDRAHGGFGGAPKFPPSCVLELLLARGEIDMALATLRAMAAGGLQDQVGGGFHRYTVDATWTVPHFEKMLYDNALLARAYLHGYQVCGDPALRGVCERALDWALREMRGPEGGFASALDADSEGVEGRFYVWTVDELSAVLGDRARGAIAWFAATPGGNFEGATNVLRGDGAPEPVDAAEIRATLLDARAARVRPGLDDKRLTSWNALMIGALADAGTVLGRRDYLDAARGCAEFVLGSLRAEDGRLLRTWRDGRAHLSAYLEDHAFLVEALLTLYEASFEERWFIAARELADTMIARYGDPERGGFYTTASDAEALIARRKDLDDAPLPSGNASAALGLGRLAALTGEHRYVEHAEGVLRLLAPYAARHPQAFGHLLRALDFHLARVREVALVGADVSELAAVVRSALRPHVVLAAGGDGKDSAVALLSGRSAVDDHPAAYVCEGFACRAPVTTAEELAALLG
jgi:uncharacterized protein YyaL (SSP411 family)